MFHKALNKGISNKGSVHINTEENYPALACAGGSVGGRVFPMGMQLGFRLGNPAAIIYTATTATVYASENSPKVFDLTRIIVFSSPMVCIHDGPRARVHYVCNPDKKKIPTLSPRLVSTS
eukprot:8417113-Pyramimonas_sp.AAC.2